MAIDRNGSKSLLSVAELTRRYRTDHDLFFPFMPTALRNDGKSSSEFPLVFARLVEMSIVES